MCSSSSDCHMDYCCSLNENGDGSCQRYLKEGEDCSKDSFTNLFTNSFLEEATTGLPSRCPCQTGLKCQQQT